MVKTKSRKIDAETLVNYKTIQRYLPRDGSLPMRGDMDFAGNKFYFDYDTNPNAWMSWAKLQLDTGKYLDFSASSSYVKFIGLLLDMNNNKIQNVPDPTNDQDADTKAARNAAISAHAAITDAHHTKYTDAEARAAINNIFGSDGKADSDIDLDSHKITNLTDPAADQNAATKKYHDDHSTMKTQYKMRAYLSVDQTGLPSGTSTLIELDTISYDPSNMFDTSTHLATIPKTGYYHIVTRIGLKNPGSGTRVGATISKVVDSTYTTLSYAVYYATGTKNIYVGLSDILYLEAGDNVCMKCYQDSGSSKNTDHGSHICFMAIHFLSE